MITNSHLLGFVTFGSFAFFALLAWAVSYRHPNIARNPPAQRRTRFTAFALLLLGAASGYGAFVLDYGMRATTLHEVMVEGNTGEPGSTGEPMLRIVPFMVEHPGVAHELFLSPAAERSQPPTSDASVSVSLQGPNGEAVLPERTEGFSVRAETENESADWDGKIFTFTPTVAGPHTVRIRPLTAGIPRIQVRLVDPLKRDGNRMPGY